MTYNTALILFNLKECTKKKLCNNINLPSNINVKMIVIESTVCMNFSVIYEKRKVGGWSENVSTNMPMYLHRHKEDLK